ncbi:hypothetical protein, variant 1 [Spizellomyces punctatus DAOM BR117]|uniref:histidine kinase n=1 Tax=Spizellomyces punctatus (strain DAOM BR117) TaxID=645134 RepID=A0A0L0HBK9_SPIPD|nr:hypothetical protein, variant 1 [Spizellomyces punctatus DAOM BR117]KNC98259.1 hypothetical protein, variant 1 [Spizellomyces punctatus DAOM BR117]|eukprot:XP_016606299.1 hypothetical protein, variant 1 [Spizellomyces punctatus DAOM BR117]
MADADRTAVGAGSTAETLPAESQSVQLKNGNTSVEESNEFERLLETCAHEPIHIPGSIQPHGLLLAFDGESRQIQIVSNNVTAFLGSSNTVARIIQRQITDCLTPASQKQFLRTLGTLKDAETGSIHTLPLEFWVDDRPVSDSDKEHVPPSLPNLPSRLFYATIHRTPRNLGLIILECEPKEYFDSHNVAQPDPNQHFFFMQTLIHQFNAASSQEELIHLAVQSIAEVTQYDRVMMYWFDADWHGVVIEEECREGFEGQRYMGLHFPASDIPQQARDLYLLTKIRVLANRSASPSNLAAAPSRCGQPLDLSFASLRSISPVHLKYLENMGVMATMSIAVMVENRLWGLIACHHYDEHIIPYQVRSTCLYISSLLSTSIENLEYSKREKQRKQIIQLAGMKKLWEAEDAGLDTAISDPSDIFWDKDSKAPWPGPTGSTSSDKSSSSSLTTTTSMGTQVIVATMDEFFERVVPEVMSWIRADYATVQYNGKTMHFNVPDNAHKAVANYIKWADARPSREVIVSTCVKNHLVGYDGLDTVLAGVVHLPISEGGTDWIAWFASEQLQNVQWGGAKDKSATYNRATRKIEPRQSFEAWKEVVTGHSRPWDEPLCKDRDLMSTLQVVLTNVLTSWRSHLLRVAHFEAMDRNARLVLERKMKKEAEWRKNMLLNHVSHELRTPLHTIKAALGLLADDTSSDSGQRELLNEANQANEELTRLIDHLMYTEVDIPPSSQSDLSDSTEEITSSALTSPTRGMRTVFNPAKVLKAVIENLTQSFHKKWRSQSNEKEVRVEIVASDLLHEVWGEQDWWQSICEALVSNALKWTNDGRVLVELFSKVETERVEGEDTVALHLIVKDWGPGIPKSKQHLLFQHLQPLDETLSRSSRSTGLGLGLSLVKKFTDAMNGTVTFDSVSLEDFPEEGTQTGTTFHVCTPFHIANEEQKTWEGHKTGDLANDPAFKRIIELIPKIERSKKEGKQAVEELSNTMETVSLDSTVNGSATQPDTSRRDHLSPVSKGEANQPFNGFNGTKPSATSVSSQNVPQPLKSAASPSSRQHLLSKRPAKAATPMKCLVVEDNLINQNLLKRQLTRRGHTVLTADDGLEAIQVWEANRDEINIILMDLAMPNMDGFDATSRILQSISHTQCKRIPIIAVTAQAMAGNKELCMEKGMDGYVSKPVDMEYLTKIMEESYWKYERCTIA